MITRGNLDDIIHWIGFWVFFPEWYDYLICSALDLIHCRRYLFGFRCFPAELSDTNSNFIKGNYSIRLLERFIIPYRLQFGGKQRPMKLEQMLHVG